MNKEFISKINNISSETVKTNSFFNKNIKIFTEVKENEKNGSYVAINIYVNILLKDLEFLNLNDHEIIEMGSQKLFNTLLKMVRLFMELPNYKIYDSLHAFINSELFIEKFLPIIINAQKCLKEFKETSIFYTFSTDFINIKNLQAESFYFDTENKNILNIYQFNKDF